MGENRTGSYAAAACFAALCLAGAARAQAPSPNPDIGAKIPSPIRDTGARGSPGAAGPRGATGAPGVVVRYEETASSGVIYLEEAGGMVSSIASPVKAPRPAAGPPVPAKK